MLQKTRKAWIIILWQIAARVILGCWSTQTRRSVAVFLQRFFLKPSVFAEATLKPGDMEGPGSDGSSPPTSRKNHIETDHQALTCLKSPSSSSPEWRHSFWTAFYKSFWGADVFCLFVCVFKLSDIVNKLISWYDTLLTWLLLTFSINLLPFYCKTVQICRNKQQRWIIGALDISSNFRLLMVFLLCVLCKVQFFYSSYYS